MAFDIRVAGLVCLAGFIGAAWGQVQQPPLGPPLDPPQAQDKPLPEQSVTETRDEPAMFKTRVNLVMVPVVVRDSKGKTVTGLTKSDFLLFDKGKPQTITRFSMEKAGAQRIKFVEDADGVGSSAASKAAQSEVPQRFIAYLFDDVHAVFGDLAFARQAAVRHISKELGATDRAGIFTTSGQGVVDFTDDRDKLIDAINRLQPRPIARGIGQECPNIGFYMADMIVNKNDASALQAATADTIACMNLSGPAAATAGPIAQGAAQRMFSAGEHESHVSYEVLKDVIRRMSATPGQRIIVLASPGFWTTDSLRPDETDVMDRAIRSNITINGLDIRGLYVPPGFDASQKVNSLGAQRVIDQYARLSAQLEGDVLAEIAYATGGTFFHDNNSMDEGFRRTAAAPETYYILGFSPQNLRLDGSFHALKVTLGKPGGHYDLQARKGYYAPKRLIDAKETAKEEIEEALFSREELRELPVDLHTQFFKGNNGMANVTILAHLDVKHFHFRKADDRNNNNVTIVSSLFDRNGNIVSAITKNLQMHLKDDTLAKKVDNGLTVRTAFSVKPGTYVVRLVVRDEEGQQISAQNGAVDIP
ncbi:MAG: VWA domain-containing protein [Bryobacteraceae bacterium]|jgi:VWFA-related protein